MKGADTEKKIKEKRINPLIGWVKLSLLLGILSPSTPAHQSCNFNR
jgi:hypothetical protein